MGGNCDDDRWEGTVIIGVNCDNDGCEGYVMMMDGRDM